MTLGPLSCVAASAAALVALAGCFGAPAPQATAPASVDPAPAKAAVAGGADPGVANPDKNAYFGDLHLHTSYSLDAAVMSMAGPDEAYQYAQGKPLKRSEGLMIQLKRPLDFLAVTDHAEYLGVFQALMDPTGPLYGGSISADFRNPDIGVRTKAYYSVVADISAGRPRAQLADPALARTTWKRYPELAARYDQPGRFTTFLAFEWTSMPGDCNLHRNVIFASLGAPAVPFSAFDSQRPEDLWTYLENARRGGYDSVAITHNGNISCGQMFAFTDSDGKPIDRSYAARRGANEVASEIIQGKGASETHPSIAMNDEFAAFEAATVQLNVMKPLTGKALGARTAYVREGLKNGLLLQEQVGINPYKIGIVAGSDSHVGATQPEEDNFSGFHGDADNTPQRRIVEPENLYAYMVGSGGLTGIWAAQNTRDALFASIKRQETFGTSGVRIRPRFFGGWSYPPGLVESEGWVRTAYRQGVPMGGTLPVRTGGGAPTFAVSALKDPDGANLDRIQIVKGWVKGGQAYDHIYDVALSGDRRVDPVTGKAPPVGSTVDLKTATYRNTIGAPELAAVWTDPDFDPTLRAFYYVRVLEIPTPRWSSYDAAKLGIAPRADVQAVIQERAWTSPIWYEPAAGRAAAR